MPIYVNLRLNTVYSDIFHVFNVLCNTKEEEEADRFALSYIKVLTYNLVCHVHP
jgi:hypothetical protein